MLKGDPECKRQVSLHHGGNGWNCHLADTATYEETLCIASLFAISDIEEREAFTVHTNGQTIPCLGLHFPFSWLMALWTS